MLEYSSLLFATNAIHAWARGFLFYAGLFVLLTVTSVTWHSKHRDQKLEESSMPAFWMDQAAIGAVIAFSILYVATRLTRPYKWLLLPLLLIAAAFGYYLCCICSWDREYPTEHAILHLIGSLCGHCILLGSNI